MRPTSLDFRSPKERTAEYYTPVVTHDGRRVRFPPAKSDSKSKPSFSREKRFLEYKITEKRSNQVLGPGAYNDIPAAVCLYKVPCLVHYKPILRVQASSEAYTMIGDQIVYEPALALKTETKTKAEFKAKDCLVDMHGGISLTAIQEYKKSSSMLQSRGGDSTLLGNSKGSKPKIYGCSMSLSNTLTRPFTSKSLGQKKPGLSLSKTSAQGRNRSRSTISQSGKSIRRPPMSPVNKRGDLTAGQLLLSDVEDYLKKNYSTPGTRNDAKRAAMFATAACGAQAGEEWQKTLRQLSVFGSTVG